MRHGRSAWAERPTVKEIVLKEDCVSALRRMTHWFSGHTMTSMKTKTLASVFTTLALAFSAAPALAADRHAAPTGSGTACSTAAPCSIQTAFAGIADNDNIYLAAGDYGSAAAPLDDQFDDNWHPVHVYGQPGTRIYDASDGMAMWLHAAGSTIEYVDLVWTGASGDALVVDGASMDHVRVFAQNGSAGRVSGQGPTAIITNSSFFSAGESSYGLFVWAVRDGSNPTMTTTLRNVTAVATGVGSTGLSTSTSGYNTPAVASYNAYNSIFRGTAYDVSAGTGDANDTGTVTIDHSNFNTSVAFGPGSEAVSGNQVNSNQSAAPAFADLAHGDLHQLAGSPTVGAGSDAQSAGTTDIDGEARLNGTVDMGADEYYAPVSQPDPDPVTNPVPGTGDQTNVTTQTQTQTGGGTTQPVVAPKPAQCVVPKVKGKTLKAAKAALLKAHCAVGKVSKKSSAGKAGKVLAQKAKAGKRLAAGAKVALVLGRRP